MLKFARKTVFSGIAFAAAALVSVPFTGYAASLNSSPSTVALTATLNESLTVSATGGPISFSLTNGSTVAGSGGVTISSSWVLNSTRTNVKLYGYFSDSTAALNDGTAGDKIPSSAVLGQVATGVPTSFTAFSQTGAFGGAGASLLLYNQSLSSTLDNFVVTNRSDTLALEIAAPADLPAGTYNGTLTIQAQAN